MLGAPAWPRVPSRPGRKSFQWGGKVSRRTALEERGNNSILTNLWHDLGRSVFPEPLCLSTDRRHRFWKRTRPGTKGSVCKAVRSPSPRAGLSEFKSEKCHVLAVCLSAHSSTSPCLSLHTGKRSAPNPQRSQKGQMRPCTQNTRHTARFQYNPHHRYCSL